MKEHKFKVGDLVRVIGSVPEAGKIGKITMVDDSVLPYRIEFEHGDPKCVWYVWYHEGNIELIKRAVETKHRPGDRFVIEVDSVLTGEDGKPLYKIKGFNALVFDDNGLDRLEPAGNEEARAFRVHYYDVYGFLQSAKARADLCAENIDSAIEMLEHIKAGDNY